MRSFLAAAVAAAVFAFPTGAAKTPPPEPPPATTSSVPAADPAADWAAQGCDADHGRIDDPAPLPAHDDGRGCQYLLHDWRAAAHADALAAFGDAQAALDEIAVEYRAAAAARNTAVTALKLAEAAVDEAVAALSPPTTTTTTTTVAPKPPPTTTLPPPTTTLHPILVLWHTHVHDTISIDGVNQTCRSKFGPIDDPWEEPGTGHCPEWIAEWRLLQSGG